MLDLVFKTIAAYLIGSLVGSLIIGKLRGGVDIRKLGSGNAGGTNALRTQGVWFALGVMVIDVGKGWFAADILPSLPFAVEPSKSEWLPIACAAAVVFGHIYPVFFDFRGGKGAATLIGVVLGLNTMAAIPTMIIWFAVLLFTGYVGLATIIATTSFPVYVLLVENSNPQFIFGIAMTLLVIFTHRGNIARMRAGTENRSQRLWLMRPR
ncbi:MAG TPA: glycerol-3-phosphate 1-O-acyltransferase PlsY [Steroidobacteraceae bacterium]|nr:glycerol-3-phosphate 1-O-acyltransferase PlsY [Steroidobacteraceae bacterium]